jgi:hypothetical protein
MRGDRGVDQVAPEPPKARERAILIRSREPAAADDIGDQDRRNFPGLAHGARSRVMQNSTGKARGRASTIESDRAVANGQVAAIADQSAALDPFAHQPAHGHYQRHGA